MSEFNILPPYQGVIHPWNNQSILEQINALGGTPINSLTSNAWPSGNLAILVPFFLSQHMYVNAIYWINGATTNGQIDMAIYDENGNKMFGTGPVAQSGVTSLQLNVMSPGYHLWAGLYYMALVAQNTTATMRSAANSMSTGTMAQVLGMAQASNAYPLPLNITGTLRTVGQDYIPGFGISSEANTFI